MSAFIRTHNETLSVAVRVSNPDHSRARIDTRAEQLKVLTGFSKNTLAITR
jgi:hypothetical protein